MPEIIKAQDTRRAFVEVLNELNDPRSVVIISDVGWNYLDDPSNRFRVINIGAMEQFAAVFACALSLEKWRVYCYSMINFVLFRCAEQVRNGAVFHQTPVTFLGVKGGPSYRFLGTGHNLLHDREDFTFCENIDLAWHHPQTIDEVRMVIRQCHVDTKPNYVRL